MSISLFLGADFTLESCVQLSLATIRVRFANDPLAVSPLGAHDALNIAFYSVSGPDVNTPIAAQTVPGDPQAIDITMAAPFTIGTWTLDASGEIRMADGRPLQDPKALSFVTTYVANQVTVANGAQSDTAATVIRKHLNPWLKGRIWNALIAALAAGDDTNWTNARLAFDQLFKCSSSGIYLDRRCADDGITRPPEIGMPDALFSKYAIKTTTKKLIQEVMLEILETFYGSDSVRAYAETILDAPYVLSDGYDLDILLDERDVVKVVFNDEDFAAIGQAGAKELAAAITRAIQRGGFKGFAIALTNPSTGNDTVRIYSGSLGLSSSVRITGGTAQPYLQFPLPLAVATSSITVSDGYSWTATLDPAGDSTTFSMTATPPVKMDLSIVQTGDWVIIDAASSGMPSGVYEVLDASFYYSGADLVQTFTLSGNALISLGVATLTATQLSEDAYQFFRPERATIQRSNGRTVVVSQSKPNELDISIPATTQAVGRTVKTAAYLNLNAPVALTAMTRIGETVTATTATPNYLVAGDQIIVEGAYPDRIPPAITLSHSSTATNWSLATLWHGITPQTLYSTLYHTLDLLNNGKVMRIGGSQGGVSKTDVELFSLVRIADGANGEKKYTYGWSAGGSMATARASHASMVLHDASNSGKVVVLGGFDGSTTLDSIEIAYASGAAWYTSGATLTYDRSWHTATMLPSGVILIAGGFKSSPGLCLSACETFNDVLDNTVTCLFMNEARAAHAAVALQDGRVLVCGGRTFSAPGYSTDVPVLDASGAISHTAEVYDEATNTWTMTGPMAYKRFGHKLVLLADGRVLCVGGYGYIATQPDVRIAIADMEVFDPGTNRWSPAGRLEAGKVWPVANLLPICNKVVTAYGLDASGVTLGLSCKYYDGDTLKQSAIPNPFTPAGHGVIDMPVGIVLSDDRLFINGGVRVSGANAQSALLLHAEDTVGSGGLNGIFAIDSATTSEFTYLTPDFPHYTVASDPTDIVVTSMKAAASSIPGPFIFDPSSGPAITGSGSITAQELVKGHSYRTLDVLDASQFPDSEGWICIGFGTEEIASPVRYLGRYSPTALILDYQYKYPGTLPVGSNVILLAQKGPYDPPTPEDVGSFYLTASSAGRIAAVQGIEDSVAAGVELHTTVVYPGDIGLGNERLVSGKKVSDKYTVWGSNDVDADVETARSEDE